MQAVQERVPLSAGEDGEHFESLNNRFNLLFSYFAICLFFHLLSIPYLGKIPYVRTMCNKNRAFAYLWANDECNSIVYCYCRIYCVIWDKIFRWLYGILGMTSEERLFKWPFLLCPEGFFFLIWGKRNYTFQTFRLPYPSNWTWANILSISSTVLIARHNLRTPMEWFLDAKVLSEYSINVYFLQREKHLICVLVAATAHLSGPRWENGNGRAILGDQAVLYICSARKTPLYRSRKLFLETSLHQETYSIDKMQIKYAHTDVRGAAVFNSHETGKEVRTSTDRNARCCRSRICHFCISGRRTHLALQMAMKRVGN